MKINNKWVRAAIPALLIHCSVGTVYCWSIFKEAIAQQIGMSSFAVGWAFSLAIFFLGMSAAFGGRFVERDIHASSRASALLFASGMIGTGLALLFFKGVPALIMIYLCYGCIMGIGLGIGYLTPVKTLILWFKENPGLGTGISIMGFGLAKVMATPLMNLLKGWLGISAMFIILGGFYFVIMMIGHVLLRKPDGWVEPAQKMNVRELAREYFRNPTFICIWLMFFLNIHCGLMIIPFEVQMSTWAFGSGTMLLAVIPMLTACFNAGGRLGWSSLSDKYRRKVIIYQMIFFSCITAGLLLSIKSSLFSIFLLIFLFVVNAGYGGGFSTLPTLLSEQFGMEKISSIHGLALSAWAVAGITGNNTAELLMKIGFFSPYLLVIIVAVALYLVAYGLSLRVD